MNNVFFLIISFGFIIMGYKFIANPIFKSSQFGIINVGEFHQYIGGAILIFGVVLLMITIINYFRLRKKVKSMGSD